MQSNMTAEKGGKAAAANLSRSNWEHNADKKHIVQHGRETTTSFSGHISKTYPQSGPVYCGEKDTELSA